MTKEESAQKALVEAIDMKFTTAYSKGWNDAVKKACEWLRNNAVICLMNEEVEDFVEDFYKAMEE